MVVRDRRTLQPRKLPNSLRGNEFSYTMITPMLSNLFFVKIRVPYQNVRATVPKTPKNCEAEVSMLRFAFCAYHLQSRQIEVK